MKKALSVCLTVALLASVAVAVELKSGLEPGKLIGPFDVVKCAGPDDKVKVGDELCYRCKYGARPMVMVFSRTTDAKVAALVKKLDGAVEPPTPTSNCRLSSTCWARIARPWNRPGQAIQLEGQVGQRAAGRARRVRKRPGRLRHQPGRRSHGDHRQGEQGDGQPRFREGRSERQGDRRRACRR